jgi:hypothetical protein
MAYAAGACGTTRIGGCLDAARGVDWAVDDDRCFALAQERGWITAAAAGRLMDEQRALADRGLNHSLWFLAQDLGVVSDAQARDLRTSISSTRVRALVVEGCEIQGRLGSGGMGDVFRALRPDGRAVAVKLLAARCAGDPEHRRRFAREARAGMRIRHIHAVPVLSAGEMDGQPYLLMELVDGMSLKAHLAAHGPLDEPAAWALIAQMAAALGHAADQGVIHRDVKPANILLGAATTGAPFHARICDFGLAKVWLDGGPDPDSVGHLTGAGLALGTPHYMSPEQAAGQADLDCRTDIYGLGATIFHALSGATLYTGRSSAVIMTKQVSEPPDLAQLSARGVSPGMRALLHAMLQKRRDDRPGSWAEVLAATQQPAAARPVPAPRLVLVWIVAGILGLAGLAWLLLAPGAGR